MSDCISIDRLVARRVQIPLISPFRISVGEVTVKDFVVLEAQCGPWCGWGEAAVDAVPFYTAETSETALSIGRTVLAPLLRSRSWPNPQAFVEAMTCIRGHSFAKAAFESVLWDLYGQSRKTSVAHLLADDVSLSQPWVQVGPSIGIKDTPRGLTEAIGRELARGYRRIKIKVCPGKDVDYLEAARAAYPDIELMVDANAAYQPHDIEHLVQWDRFRLVMIEQPLDHDDLWFHRELCRRMQTPICLDESIQTPHLAACALEMKAADVVNIKVGRVGGLVNTKRVHDLCRRAGVPVWIGSRLGSGIAEAGRLAAASLPNATFPSDVGAGRVYLADDLVDDWFEVRNGCEAKVPDGPGLGIRVNRDKLERYTMETIEW